MSKNVAKFVNYCRQVCTMVNVYRKVVVLSALACGMMASAMAQESASEIGGLLAGSGYANVRTFELKDMDIFSLENDRYKIQADGIANALKLIDAASRPDRITKVIATSFDVPELTLTYDPAVGRWETTYRLDESWKLVRKEKKMNSSFGKVDVVVYPQVSLMNLIITQVYQSLWQLSPSVEVSLWPGGKIAAMVKFPVYNDGYGYLESKVHPGLITVSQRFRIPGNVFGRASAGVFTNNRHGASLDLFYPFPNERFSLESQIGLIGLGYWNGFVFHMDDDYRFYWSFGGSYYWPQQKTQFILRAQKFLMDDYGVKYEMMRHFNHCTIGFYALKGFSGQHLNVGFRYQISLPPYRLKRYGYWPKVRLGHTGMVYNANNELKYYKEYKSEAGENIMERNAFNPYFVSARLEELNVNN